MNLTIEFGEWLPDQSTHANPGVADAKNCAPAINGYGPFNALVTTTDALTAYARGAASFVDKSGVVESYAGDATKLYRLAADSWADKSGATYTNGTDDFWQFAKWGETVIATNFADAVQTKAFGAGTNFAALSGSPPKAKYITTVKSFVVLGFLNDGSDRPNRVQWSGQNAETSWGTNPATQADYQDLVGNGGAIKALSGGDNGVIFQERSLWIMSYTGPPTVFSFREIPGLGTPCGRSVVRYGDLIWWYGNDGFYQMSVGSGAVEKIGDQKVDQWFFDRLEFTNRVRVVGAVDAANSLVIWSFPQGSSDPDLLLVYNWAIKRWSWVEPRLANGATTGIQYIWSGLSPGYTLEDLDSISSDLDALTASLDSAQWKGGSATLYAFDDNKKSGAFSGDALAAIIGTGEISSPDNAIIMLNEIAPIIEITDAPAGGNPNNTITVDVGTRNALSEDVTWTTGLASNSIGNFNTRVSGRYVQLRTNGATYMKRGKGFAVTTRGNGVR